MTSKGASVDSDTRTDQELLASAMTRQLSVSLGRRISLDDLSENSQNETVKVDSPQNGEVDVVTVDNGPEDEASLTAPKVFPTSPQPEIPRPASRHKSSSSPARHQSPARSSRSPKPSWPSPRSSHSSPGRGDAPTVNKNRRFEACILNKAKVWLPLQLIEQSKIFHEVVSLETWNNVLSTEDRERLSKMLPEFPESDEAEKTETLTRLFSGENFKFGNPARKLQKDLRAGYLYLEVFKHKRALRQAKYREYKHQQELRCHRMLKEVLIARQELLEAAQFTAPDEPFKVKRPRPLTAQKELDEMVTKKYRKILKECRVECGELYTSDDDDDVSIAKEKTPTKKRSTAWYEAPSDIVLPTFTPRVQSTFDHKPIDSQLGPNQDGSPEDRGDVTLPPAAPDSPLQLTEATYMDMIDKHQRRRDVGMDHFELDASNITLEDVMTRTFATQNSPIVPSQDFRATSMPLSQKRKAKVKDKLAKKRKKGRPPKVTTPISVVSLESRASLATTESSGSLSTNQEGPTMAVDAGKDEDLGSVQSSPKSMLYPNFFSFLRDTLRESPDSHMTLAELQERTEAWQGAPVSALNVWFMLMASWSKALGSMLKFLIGELPSMPIKAPMVEYNDAMHTWGWIGEGRDSDEQLTILFKQWLTAVLEEKPTPPEIERQASPTVPSPIKVHTDFVVRPSTAEEKAVFRAQEHERYEQPHKAYTYCMHSYKSVVGPVKGVYGKETSLNKAREHSLLVSDRPPYVTILSLVRDAVARLPNGEGTRAEVCELLKDSKFLADATDNQINTVVSGALDRLHYEKDPCVKYDGNRKLWIYLHRNRSEEEFERLHLEQAVSIKAKRSIQKQAKPVHRAKPVIKDMQLFHPAGRPPSALSDTSNDSIISVGMGLETPSPSRSPGSSSLSPHSFAKSPASSSAQSPIGSLLGGKAAQRATKAPPAVQPQLLHQRHLSSPAAVSGSQAFSSQVQALLTHAAMPSVLVPSSSVASSEVGAYQSGNSLIKAQLLAPRGFVAQLASQQLGASPQKGSQPVRSATSTPQMTAVSVPSLMMGQLLSHPEQVQQLSTESPGRKGNTLSTSKPGMTPSTNQPITLTLTGANAPGDKSKAQPSSAIPAALAFHSKPGTLPVNVTLTLKGATEEKKTAASGGASRGHGGKTKLPTVGGLLAGLGMSLEGVSTPRAGRKPSTKSKSPPRASAGKTASSQSPSSASRRKSQPRADGPVQDQVITFQPATSAAFVPPQKGPLLTSPMFLGNIAAGIHQPSASGLILQTPVGASSTQPATTTSSKKTPALTASQSSAMRTLTSLASQQTLHDKAHSNGTSASTSHPAQTELSSIPMSLLMASAGSQGGTGGQGVKAVSVVGSPGHSLPQGAISLITNPLLSTGIPASLTAGKGVILQVPIGSKRVSAIPATLSKQKCTAPVILTSSTLTSSLMTPVVTQGSSAASKDQAEKPVEGSKEGSVKETSTKEAVQE